MNTDNGLECYIGKSPITLCGRAQEATNLRGRIAPRNPAIWPSGQERRWNRW